MILFVYAQHELYWLLHYLHAFRQMLSYYFAAGHAKYAHLQSMEVLPTDVHMDFIKGEYTRYRFPGSRDGTWSEMFTE